MRPFRHLMVVGMGAIVVLSNSGRSASQTVPSLSQSSPPKTTQIPKSPDQSKQQPPAKTVRPTATQQADATPTNPGGSQPSILDRAIPRLSPASQPGTTSPLLPSSQTTPVPEQLKANPNPLQFPTRPDEVQIQTNQPITLQQALELARRNNRQLQVSLLELERSQASLREARAAEYPSLDAQAAINRQQSPNSSLSARRQEQQQENIPPELRQSTEVSASTSLSGTVQLSYDIYTAGRRSAQIRAAEKQVRFNELAVEQLAEETYLDVINDYYDLQEADEQVGIATAAVGNAQKSLADAEALERAGVGTRFDVLRAQVQLANARQELTQARSQQQISQRQLAQRLSLPQSANITAADPVEQAGPWDLPLADTIVLAFQNRAELEQQLLQREINEEQRRVALAAIRPQVGLTASYNVLDVLDDGLGLADGYAIGANVRWNFFDGGAARARAEQQEINQEIAETRFADLRNQVRFQVEQAYFTLQANLENVQTASVALTQAEESLRLARLRFQAGVGTQTDVINAETELTRAQGNVVRAILGYNRALAALRRSTSNLAATQPTINRTP